MVYPTVEQFREYSGENISNKLQGDIKDPLKLWEILCKRAERVIKNNLRGIQVEDLTDEEIVFWQELIMEQCEYYLSVGDKSLMDGQGNAMTSNVMDMAIQYGLWSPCLC